MAEYVEILKTGEMKNGEMRELSIQEQNILLARVDGKFYATSNLCPHLRGRLALGTLDGTVVTCPRHGSQFDLKDGHVVRWTGWSGVMLTMGKLLRSPRPLQTYPVRIKEDNVLVEI